MNSRLCLHRSKNNQPNRRSTHCRTDDTLAADGVSHSDSQPPPATRGCHPPPESVLPIYYPYPDPYPFQKHLHFCTGRRPICTFARYRCLPMSPCPHAPALTRCIPCQRVNLPAGQLVIPLANRPTDQRINKPMRLVLVQRSKGTARPCVRYYLRNFKTALACICSRASSAEETFRNNFRELRSFRTSMSLPMRVSGGTLPSHR